MRLGNALAAGATAPPTVSAKSLLPGSMASSIGRATTAPMPRRNVRRGICQFLLIIGMKLLRRQNYLLTFTLSQILKGDKDLLRMFFGWFTGPPSARLRRGAFGMG